jgi:hypothetical protein
VFYVLSLESLIIINFDLSGCGRGNVHIYGIHPVSARLNLSRTLTSARVPLWNGHAHAGSAHHEALTRYAQTIQMRAAQRRHLQLNVPRLLITRH